jgi:Asp-tRNA(Asn)/Glu-tRNA(Gln) amidotransferase A subunit family amidase
MKRYTPNERERAQIAAMERGLGIPGAEGPGGGKNPGAEGSVVRMAMATWRRLWHEDPAAWFRELRDRPKRFDAAGWRRGIIEWHNEMPRVSPAGEAGFLSGVPFLVKDLFDVRGERTTAGSTVLVDPRGPTDGASAARSDAWLPAALRSLGAHPVGRTTMNEFAYGLDGRNSRTGDCPHPLDRERISGGSSSGSAWAVAAGVAPLALGTDTGGSIRVPAALCGIYGFRMAWEPTRLAGVFPLSRRMDTVGWLVADAADAAELLRWEVTSRGAVGGERPDQPHRDAGRSRAEDSLSATVASLGSSIEGESSRPLRVGAFIPPAVVLDDRVAEFWEARLDALAAGAVEALVLERPEGPDVFGDEAWKAYNVIGSTDAWEVHAEWLDRYRNLYDPVVWALIDRGRHWSRDRVLDAERRRDEIASAFVSLFAEFDVLVLPVTPIPSPRHAEADGRFRERVLRLNAPVSLAGLPALSVPLHHHAVESSGMQVVAPAGSEELILRFLQIWSRLGSGAAR